MHVSVHMSVCIASCPCVENHVSPGLFSKLPLAGAFATGPRDACPRKQTDVVSFDRILMTAA